MTTRGAALSRLLEFMPRVPHYASARNYVRPGYEDVSRLSQWIRYRILSEEECVATVLEHHSAKTAEKFLQEILWRTYWKGWLELRPSVWFEYLSDITNLTAEYDQHELYQRAITGNTPLSFFNEWISELTATGYLHNHTRMWFASVWIFTLQLPWQLGARFMYQHLLDADPASNTLSWRWVAGLHTPGKIYVARPDNISTYSEGRWRPKDSELTTNPPPPSVRETPALPDLPPATSDTPRSGSLILLHDDDLSADLSVELEGTDLHYCLFTPTVRESSSAKATFVSALRDDTSKRCKATLITSAKDIAGLAQALDTSQIHTMIPRVGFECEDVRTLTMELRTLGISTVWHRRVWDERLMPKARGGFFKFWEHVKPLL